MLNEYENNAIVKRSVEFALMVISFSQRLENDKKIVIARQLLRCGTSIGANV